MTEPTDLFSRAVDLLKSGDAKSAREIAERAIANTGESASLCHFLGVACCQCGDLDAGIGHLERAAELAPRDLGVLLMLMRALIDAGRPRDALSRAFEGMACHGARCWSCGGPGRKPPIAPATPSLKPTPSSGSFCSIEPLSNSIAICPRARRDSDS